MESDYFSMQFELFQGKSFFQFCFYYFVVESHFYSSTDKSEVARVNHFFWVEK